MLDTRDTADGQLAQRITTTGNPVYARAFEKLLKFGRDALSPEESRAVMAVGVDATGGFAVPYALDPTMVAIGAHTTTNPYRQACRVESIVGSDTWRGLTATAVTATRAEEAAASTDSSPTFAQPEAIVKRVHSVVVYSIEFGQDRPSLAADMSRLFNEAKDTEEESSFSIGAGAGTIPDPIGMFAAHATGGAFTHYDTTTSVTLAIGDLYKLEGQVPIRHRANACWFMNRVTIRTIQGFETTSGILFNSTYGYPAVGVINRSPVGNTGLTLLGYPVYEVPSAPTGLVANTPVAFLGDPSSFLVVDRVGMSVELIPHFLSAATGYPTGQRMLYAIWRNTAKPINIDGGRVLTILT
jgi:HK97 family phage major capsid protein